MIQGEKILVQREESKKSPPSRGGATLLRVLFRRGEKQELATMPRLSDVSVWTHAELCGTVRCNEVHVVGLVS